MIVRIKDLLILQEFILSYVCEEKYYNNGILEIFEVFLEDLPVLLEKLKVQVRGRSTKQIDMTKILQKISRHRILTDFNLETPAILISTLEIEKIDLVSLSGLTLGTNIAVSTISLFSRYLDNRKLRFLHLNFLNSFKFIEEEYLSIFSHLSLFSNLIDAELKNIHIEAVTNLILKSIIQMFMSWIYLKKITFECFIDNYAASIMNINEIMSVISRKRFLKQKEIHFIRSDQTYHILLHTNRGVVSSLPSFED